MVNAKKTSFTATQVAKNSMAMGAAFMCILELEKEVSRLRHHVSVLSKRLNGKGEEKMVAKKEEVAEVLVAEAEAEAEVAAVGGPPITSGVYKVVVEEEDVAEEIVAGVELMSVGSGDDEDEVIDGRIVVRQPGDRKRRIAEAGGSERVEEKALVRAIPVGPRSGERSGIVGGRVPSGPSSVFSGRGRGCMGRVLVLGWKGTGIGVEGEGEEGTIISTVTFVKPCGVGRLRQPLCTVISHTRKRGFGFGMRLGRRRVFCYGMGEADDPSDDMFFLELIQHYRRSTS